MKKRYQSPKHKRRISRRAFDDLKAKLSVAACRADFEEKAKNELKDKLRQSSRQLEKSESTLRAMTGVIFNSPHFRFDSKANFSPTWEFDGTLNLYFRVCIDHIRIFSRGCLHEWKKRICQEIGEKVTAEAMKKITAAEAK